MSIFHTNDSYWAQKLPRNYNEILAKAVSPVAFRSNRELHRKFRRSFLIEGGTQKVWLTGNDQVVLMVSAKGLDITYGLDSRYWEWVAREDSKFQQLAELKSVDCFEVWQRIECTLLTPETEYSVRFVLKIDKNSLSTCLSPFTFSLKKFNGDLMESDIYLDDFAKGLGTSARRKTIVKYETNGWIEFVAGEFVSKKHGERSEIEVCMKNTDSRFSKSGIVIDGVKIRPK